MSNWVLVGVALGFQLLCAVFFVSDIAVSLFGIPVPPYSWFFHELVETGAALGLIIGVIVSTLATRHALARSRKAETALRAASGAFMEVLEERFETWGLTPAERDVALFAIKGMSTQEIADLRNTSEGTVKAQSNAIYRKAGVSGRPQLLSVFIDELMTVEASCDRAPSEQP
ncbi:MAG: LuxR C-terminal-related transcriptional regulator [Pseudomonadota bacterium]